MTASLPRLVDLIENPAVIEMLFLRGLPRAEHVADGEKLDLRELFLVLLGYFGIDGAVVVLPRQLLSFGRVEELEVRLCHGFGAVLLRVLVDDGNGRLRQNAERRS